MIDMIFWIENICVRMFTGLATVLWYPKFWKRPHKYSKNAKKRMWDHKWSSLFEKNNRPNVFASEL